MSLSQRLIAKPSLCPSGGFAFMCGPYLNVKNDDSNGIASEMEANPQQEAFHLLRRKV